jgi:DNA-binding CsgD family transcriptional regulator
MTILISRINNNGVATSAQEMQTPLQKYLFPRNCEQSVLPEEVIENLIDGILLISEQKELIYANDCARRILRQLNQGSTLTSLVPGEIWHICQTLISSRRLFPNQYWLIESKVCIDSSIVFNVRAKWLKLEDIENPYLLLSISDQYQYIKDIAIEESQKYGLTARERETWLLHRANYTYKQIASELCITPNTVKKHMKNIYLKQKAVFILQTIEQ